MSVILALDPGYLRTRVGIWREGEPTVSEVAIGEDPFEAGESIAGCTPSVVVLPGGPPAGLYPWHPRNIAAAGAAAYCEARGIPRTVIGAGPGQAASLPPKARLSGFPGRDRKATFYEVPESDAFSAAAQAIGVSPDEARIIVVYLGDEVSVSARARGVIVDSSDPAACEGPFGFTSCGTLPATSFVSYVASSGLGAEELLCLLKSGSGALAYTGNDSAKGFSGMAYQVAKEVGRQMAALRGASDCITLCGPGARVSPLVEAIESRVGKWAMVLVQSDDLVMSRLFMEGTKVISKK